MCLDMVSEIGVFFQTDKAGYTCILQINGVRMAINIVLGSEQAVSNWGEDAINRLQDSARKKLMR